MISKLKTKQTHQDKVKKQKKILNENLKQNTNERKKWIHCFEGTYLLILYAEKRFHTVFLFSFFLHLNFLLDFHSIFSFCFFLYTDAFVLFPVLRYNFNYFFDIQFNGLFYDVLTSVLLV